MKSFSSYTIAPEHAGLPIEAYLKQILCCSGRSLQKLTRKKGIRLNGKPAYLQKQVKAGDTLQVLVIEDAEFGVQPEAGEIELLYEDEYLLIANKPPRQLVHPSRQTISGTLANFLAFQLQQRGIVSTIRPIHRIDRDTSGCVMLAKDSRSQFLLEQQLITKTMKRTYWALVKGIVSPPSGTITAPIGRHPNLPNRRAISEHGEPAITHYQVRRTFKDCSLLELTLDTGRTHQIRIHLAHLGYPIIGDGMYGVRVSWMHRQALHAAAISFRHVGSGQELTIEAPLPVDFTRALDHCANPV